MLFQKGFPNLQLIVALHILKHRFFKQQKLYSGTTLRHIFSPLNEDIV
jgi:hypothetical protein